MAMCLSILALTVWNHNLCTGCLDVWNLEFWIIVWIFNDFHLELPFIEVQLSANELYSSTGSSSSLNNVMESEVMGLRPTRCVCNLPIKK